MSVPRIVIAGTHSGVGKTSVTLAVMAGLRKAGYRVQGFKVGPDYIDPGYHALSTGRPSHNLDDWLMGSNMVRAVFDHACRDCDVAVIEGVMGLFDGASSTGDAGSTAGIAKMIGSPVVLVVDASRMARSVAAMIKGYQTLDPTVTIGGVILNRVASENHFHMLREAVDCYNHIPVLGAISRDESIAIPQRHLGLTTASENIAFQTCLTRLESLSAPPRKGAMHIDLTRVMDLARRVSLNDVPVPGTVWPLDDTTAPPVRLAYAKDRAFQFYYQANLDVLTALGAELVPFSPLEDERLPEGVGGLYFGGGFPEVYAKLLQANSPMRRAVREAVDQGMPVYAECGGLIYLAPGIISLDGEKFEMAGVIPGMIQMTERLQNFGYCENTLLDDCFLGLKGETFRGHEFHYSFWTGEGERPLQIVEKKRRKTVRPEGYCAGHVAASYVHCHFLSYPQRARALVLQARDFIARTSAMTRDYNPILKHDARRA